MIATCICSMIMVPRKIQAMTTIMVEAINIFGFIH